MLNRNPKLINMPNSIYYIYSSKRTKCILLSIGLIALFLLQYYNILLIIGFFVGFILLYFTMFRYNANNLSSDTAEFVENEAVRLKTKPNKKEVLVKQLKHNTPEFNSEYQQRISMLNLINFFVTPALVLFTPLLWYSVPLAGFITHLILSVTFFTVVFIQIKQTRQELIDKFERLSLTVELANQFQTHGVASEIDLLELNDLLVKAERILIRAKKDFKYLRW